MRHLLVTNDYPPKFGGIQNYLWELYRRLPPDEFTVLTRPYPGWEEWDAEQNHEIIRTRQRVLVPEPWLARQIKAVVEETGADIVMYDPGLPLGALGPRLGLPYGVILHGAEVTVPGRIPGSRAVLGEVLRKADLVVTAGDYSTREAERAAGCQLPIAVVPPGVDSSRFVALDGGEVAELRGQYGVPANALVVLTLSRLVPRKGMDVLIKAVAALKDSHPDLVLFVAGSGRDRARLERLAGRLDAPVRFLGRVPDSEVPGLYATADLFAMMCRVRWGGLEQEGFGIVFLEAAAAGVPQIAGRSGGAAEAVADGQTGLVVDDPTDVVAVAEALGRLLSAPDERAAMGVASRQRATERFDYDLLAGNLRQALLAATEGHDPRGGAS
ncbi:MAG: glycosyltransferase family 4 protein [Acidimicrobiales bacterium]